MPPRTAPSSGLAHLHDAGFSAPERVPWSVLGPQFHTVFGRADPADPQPEHIEIIGQNGSGKTHFLGKLYQERAVIYQGSRTHIIVATKPADDTLHKIGFPIVSNTRELLKGVDKGERAFIYWARTPLVGSPRKHWHESRIAEVLDLIWHENSDTDVAIDDSLYCHKLPEVRERIEMILREGRSSGISGGILKQRGQGGSRLESSETHWTGIFPPKDDDDLERWAELLGARRDWMPVVRDLDPLKREFILRHNRSKTSYITWVDEPLAPVELPRKRRDITGMLGWNRKKPGGPS